jgi:hypothetical protein
MYIYKYKKLLSLNPILMKLKTFFLAFSLFLAFSAFSQECGSKLSPNHAALYAKYLQLAAVAPNPLPHDTCLNKELSVVFWIFLDSLGNNNVIPGNITTCIKNLNKYFKPICLKFDSCVTKYIPEHEYNKWIRADHEPKIVGNSYNYYIEKTINIYLVDNLITPAANGYAHPPGGRDLIVIRKTALTSMTPVHEMGHFFGLPHTFAEISINAADGPSSEFSNLTNSQTTGDGFYDTDADPYSIGSGSGPCGYVYGPKDANNQYYVPPVDNIMSYWGCRCRFTIEQLNWMAYTYLTARNYLH